jgi:hypothetical protein
MTGSNLTILKGDRIFTSLKVEKQAPGYKTAVKVLDQAVY